MNRISRAGVAAALVLAIAGLAGCGGTDASPAPGSTSAPTPSVALPTAQATEITATPGAVASPAAITLTVEDEACSYDGPRSIPYGAYEVSFVVRDTAPTEHGWFVFTLAPGRTLDEARSAIETSGEDEWGPDWITFLTVHPFETTGVAKVARENLRQMGAYTGGPIYIMCARPDRILGIFGPIEVVQ